MHGGDNAVTALSKGVFAKTMVHVIHLGGGEYAAPGGQSPHSSSSPSKTPVPLFLGRHPLAAVSIPGAPVPRSRRPHPWM